MYPYPTSSISSTMLVCIKHYYAAISSLYSSYPCCIFLSCNIINSSLKTTTAAAVNSGVRVGEGTFIGSNACVRQGARIGAHCVIGMGQCVLKDCPDHSQLPAARTE